MENPSRDPRVIELSRLLRALPFHTKAARKESFRNPDGVAFKLQNLRQLATGRGFSNVSNMDRAVWAELGVDRAKVKELAELIRAGSKVAAEYEHDEDDDDDDEGFAEGRTVTVAHKRRERKKGIRMKLIKKRKQAGSPYMRNLQYSPA